MTRKKLNFEIDEIVETKDITSNQNRRAEIAKVAQSEGFTSRQTKSVKIDGRSMRRTARKHQLNISVTAETRDKFWELASSLGYSSGGELLDFLINSSDKK